MSTPQQFITERKYLMNVTPASIVWYEQSFKRFDGALESRATVIQRISELRERGLCAVSVNVHLRAVNAFFMWLHKEHGKELIKIPKLKEEQKVLATFSAEQVKRFINWKAVGRNETRVQLAAAVALDGGLRITELLSLVRSDVDLDNLLLRVKGKGNKHRLVPMSIELRKLLYPVRPGVLHEQGHPIDCAEC